MDEYISAACEIKSPAEGYAKNAGNNIQAIWLMEKFCRSLAEEMFIKACHEIVKEFKDYPEEVKTIKFGLSIETL